MQSQDLSKISSNVVIERLQTLVAHERKITAEVIEYVKEVDRRRIYLELGYTSLFSYMTEGLGYTGGAAQRRIDSARLMREMPEIKEDLKSGALNLMQVSMLAHCVRQKQKEEPTAKVEVKEKREMLELVKNQDLQKTQVILATKFDLEIKVQEKTTHQRDESVRLETAFSIEQMAEFTRVKELISHTHPNITWAELMTFLAKAYLKKNDPLMQPLDKRQKEQRSSEPRDEATSGSVAAPAQSESGSRKLSGARSKHFTYWPVRTKRLTYLRDGCCQWRDARTGRICGSRFQLELDHIVPRWAGGTNAPGNAQLLCSTHNKLKYRFGAQVKYL